jgi:hypothetical protein
MLARGYRSPKQPLAPSHFRNGDERGERKTGRCKTRDIGEKPLTSRLIQIQDILNKHRAKNAQTHGKQQGRASPAAGSRPYDVRCSPPIPSRCSLILVKLLATSAEKGRAKFRRCMEARQVRRQQALGQTARRTGTLILGPHTRDERLRRNGETAAAATQGTGRAS